ncbi:mitochondrial matrix protein frataxin [Haematococcus lacustris]
MTTGHASEQDFHKLADTTLDELHEVIEAYVEGLNLDDSDVEYSQGVLSVKLGKAGTYVLNKQAPNRQIWLSSPVSGPLRFDWDSQRQQWVYHRDGRELLSLLDAELTKLCGQSPRLTPA